MLIGYARVSTEEQSLNRQIDALTDYGIDKRNIYQEKVTGTKKDREQLQKMISELQVGDTVVLSELVKVITSLAGLGKVLKLEAKTSLRPKVPVTSTSSTERESASLPV